MQNRFLYVTIFIVFMSSYAFAAQNVAGQNYYLKNCSSCHGKGNRGGGLAASYEWEEYFANNAKDMKYFHEDEPIPLKYLNSDKFKKQKKKILKFLIEFASDSQSIPSCNN